MEEVGIRGFRGRITLIYYLDLDYLLGSIPNWVFYNVAEVEGFDTS